MKKELFPNKHSVVLTLVMGVIFSSCNEWLTLTPEDSTIEEEFWRNGNQVESVVRACYRYMQEDDFMQRIVLWGELRSDEVCNGSAITTAERDIVEANARASNSLCSWAPFYEVINYCNKVIEYAPGVMERDANFRPVTCDAYLAEAYTIRAMCYFWLIRTFRDVPLVTESSDSDERNYNVSNRDTLGWMTFYHIDGEKMSFSSQQYPQVNQERYVLDNIINDLTVAIALATDIWDTDAETKGRVTRPAVRALLADCLLWRASITAFTDQEQAKKDYEAVVGQCNLALQDCEELEMSLVEGSNLLRDVFYTGNSEESIFELNFTTSGHANNATASIYGNSVKSTNAHIGAAVGLSELFNQNAVADNGSYDCRSKDFFNAANNSIFKYEGQTPPSDFEEGSYTYRAASSQANWIFYRLPDIYLIKAEALAELAMTAADADAVVALCNRTYIRACTANGETKDSLDHSAYASTSDLRRLVLAERARELMFEGKRWFDLLRLVRRSQNVADGWDYIESKYDEDVTTIRNKMSSIDAWYLPISLDEMKINTELTQNDYYGSQNE